MTFGKLKNKMILNEKLKRLALIKYGKILHQPTRAMPKREQ
jgi:hypothetical protein